MNGPTALTPGGQHAPTGHRLLLAVACPATRRFLSEILCADYAVEEAADGEAAWEAARREVPTLVLADVRLPLLDGISLAYRLHADANTAKVPVLLLSASNAQALLRQGWDVGAHELLLKPLKINELMEKLRLLQMPPRA